MDKERQWFKAAVGLSAKETHRNVSFCSHAILRPELFIVENATTDDRFRDNSLVTGEPGIRFYAGIPLHAPNGFAMGTLCVIDTVPRTLSESQKNALTILGRQVKARMELRQKQKSLENAMAVNDQLLATLRDRNNLFSAFMNNGPFVSYIKDGEGRMVFYNQRMNERFGFEGDAWIGKSDHDLWPAEMADAFRRNDLDICSAGVPVEVSEISPGLDGQPIHWKSYKFPFYRENGDIMLAGMSIDITEELQRKSELERTLREKSELATSLESSTLLFKTFVNNNPNVCYFKAEDGKYLSYNTKFEELFGVGKDTWIGKSDHDVLPKEVADEYRAHDLVVIEHGEVAEVARQIADPAGNLVWLKSIKFPIRLADGRTILGGVAVDISREVEEERALEEANALLERLATTDMLTGLSNRRVFEERIGIEFANAARKERSLSLMVMDIDNFKRRNDTYGHAAGDDALRALGNVLLGAIRIGDVAARIGGEEFVILLPETDATEAAALAERVQALLRQTDSVHGELTVSIGVAAISPFTAPSFESWERLLSRADTAMYEAKRSGKDRIVLSPASLNGAPETPLEPMAR